MDLDDLRRLRETPPAASAFSAALAAGAISNAQSVHLRAQRATTAGVATAVVVAASIAGILLSNRTPNAAPAPSISFSIQAPTPTRSPAEPTVSAAPAASQTPVSSPSDPQTSSTPAAPAPESSVLPEPPAVDSAQPATAVTTQVTAPPTSTPAETSVVGSPAPTTSAPTSPTPTSPAPTSPAPTTSATPTASSTTPTSPDPTTSATSSTTPTPTPSAAVPSCTSRVLDAQSWTTQAEPGGFTAVLALVNTSEFACTINETVTAQVRTLGLATRHLEDRPVNEVIEPAGSLIVTVWYPTSEGCTLQEAVLHVKLGNLGPYTTAAPWPDCPAT